MLLAALAYGNHVLAMAQNQLKILKKQIFHLAMFILKQMVQQSLKILTLKYLLAKRLALLVVQEAAKVYF